MSRTLELPDSVYDALLAAAQADRTTPADWVAARLQRPPDVTEAARAAANARLRQARVGLRHATSIDNDRIDADLARAYADDHAGADGQNGQG